MYMYVYFWTMFSYIHVQYIYDCYTYVLFFLNSVLVISTIYESYAYMYFLNSCGFNTQGCFVLKNKLQVFYLLQENTTAVWHCIFLFDGGLAGVWKNKCGSCRQIHVSYSSSHLIACAGNHKPLTIACTFAYFFDGWQLGDGACNRSIVAAWFCWVTICTVLQFGGNSCNVLLSPTQQEYSHERHYSSN